MATVLGSRPILNVDADPNTILGLEVQSVLESQFATDVTTGLVYKYDPALPEGTRWVIYDTRPYKVYTALLTQSGTDAPVATVLENTLGKDVVWTRFSAGTYRGTFSSPYSAEEYPKILIDSRDILSYNTNTTSVSIKDSVTSTRINIVASLVDIVSGTKVPTDVLLFSKLIEIRVYP